MPSQDCKLSQRKCKDLLEALFSLFQVFIEFVTILLLLFMLWFFGPEACGILASWPVIE